jgi:phenylacetic acid degradation operon negative regulatory protein
MTRAQAMAETLPESDDAERRDRFLFSGKPVVGARPQSMIFTLYGDYIHPAGGVIWINSLVRLLGHLGVPHKAVRSTVWRMRRNGLLHVERVERRSYYSLTPASKKIIQAASARIFQFPSKRGLWDGQWHLVTYSVPENEREARDRLRHELAWMGFGMLSNALWISPHDHRREIEHLGDSLGVRVHIEMFNAQHEGFSDPRRIVSRCWDLEALNARYAAFIDEFAPMHERHSQLLARGKDIEPSEYFVRRFALVHQFRRFPYIDPGLPDELLPSDWCGTVAATLFHQYHDLLTDKANAFFYSIYEKPVRQPGDQVSRADRTRKMGRSATAQASGGGTVGDENVVAARA